MNILPFQLNGIKETIEIYIKDAQIIKADLSYKDNQLCIINLDMKDVSSERILLDFLGAPFHAGLTNNMTINVYYTKGVPKLELLCVEPSKTWENTSEPYDELVLFKRGADKPTEKRYLCYCKNIIGFRPEDWSAI